MRVVRLFLGIVAAICLVSVLCAQSGVSPQEKPAVPEAASNWHTVFGRVVSVDISKNLLVLKTSAGELKLNVPGRVNMLELKTGDWVRLQYVQAGGRLGLWSLTKGARKPTVEEAKR
jgi:hypothetical protein